MYVSQIRFTFVLIVQIEKKTKTGMYFCVYYSFRFLKFDFKTILTCVGNAWGVLFSIRIIGIALAIITLHPYSKTLSVVHT